MPIQGHNRRRKHSLCLLILMSFTLFITSSKQINKTNQSVGVRAVEALVGSTSVIDRVVGRTTLLNFQIFTSIETVDDGDYLIINLPTDQDVSFRTGKATCQGSPVTVKMCQVLSASQARLNFEATGSLKAIEGSISNFNNPQSARQITGIELSLYTKEGEKKASMLSASLSSFQPTTVEAELGTSSRIVGDTGQQLSVTVEPATLMTAEGRLIIDFPDYYSNAGSDQMISTAEPYCYGGQLTVLSCKFNTSLKQLILIYQFSDKRDRRSSSTFYVKDFKNPISTKPKTGFKVTTADENNFPIGESTSLTLSGVTEATDFQFVTFSFDDTNRVQEYSNFKVNVAMRVPLEQQCFFKIEFPPQFEFDTQLYGLSGTQFFTPASGPSALAPWRKLDRDNRIVITEGCQYIWGPKQTGSLTFRRVKNPKWLQDTDTFKVWIADDPEFESIIASQTDSLPLRATQLSPGMIDQVQITAIDTLVSAVTAYSFDFSPRSDIDNTDGAYLTIDLPPLVEIADQRCQLTAPSLSFTGRPQCAFDNKQITISDAFSKSNSFEGGTPLSVSIAPLVNPISVRDVGDFVISTYIRADGQVFKVDQMTITKQVMTQAGLISKVEDIESSSYETYDFTTTYIFHLKFEHTIPVNGFVRVMLPPEMFIANRVNLQSYCYRLDYSPQPISMQCKASTNYFDVTIVKSKFGSNGLPAGEPFRLQVVSLANPREEKRRVNFAFSSHDEQDYVIDKSKDSQQFAIMMNSIGDMFGVDIEIKNKTNGAKTTYTFKVRSNTPVLAGDKLSFDLPEDVRMPPNNRIGCRGDPRKINRMSCYQQSSKTIVVVFDKISSIQSTLPFWFQIEDLRNPVSTKKSRPFQNFLLQSMWSLRVTQYTFDDVTVQTSEVSHIQNKRLVQSSQTPDERATYTIIFQTNNPLPPTTAIQVYAPATVKFRSDSYQCFVRTKSRQNRVCSFSGSRLIKIKDAFKDNGSSYYEGEVQIQFQAVNPPNNENKDETLSLTIYENKNFEYKIDVIESGLSPYFKCQFPCLTCDLNNSNQCTSCPKGRYDPKYLQPDLERGTVTCKTSCDLGFTYDNKASQYVCEPCDVTCQTCRGGGDKDDREYCTSCKGAYPFFWKAQAKCFADSCPKGSFESSFLSCQSCPNSCLDCTSMHNCIECDPLGKAPLRQLGLCVEECMPGKTPLYQAGLGSCIDCEAPCSTCAPGQPRNCTSCAEGDRQFIFGSQCLSECPTGTTLNMEAKRCDGCLQGCAECSVYNNAECLVCEEGLALIDSNCVAECPPDYKKSRDGTTCELRQYPLDNYFIPFPFTAVTIVLFIITLISYKMTKRKTLIIQTFIMQANLAFLATIVFMLFKALWEVQWLFIVTTVLALGGNIVLNGFFVSTFVYEVEDYQFGQYVKHYRWTYRILLAVSFGVSLHLFRGMFCKLFSLERLSASATQPQDFYQPLYLYSMLNIFVIVLPMIGVSTYGVAVTIDGFWDNQLQMTMFECILIGLLQIGLLLYERYCQNPRNLVFKPSHESPYFIGVFTDKKEKINDEVGGGTGGPTSSFWPLAEKASRHEKLKALIKAVKANKDLMLNNKLDVIMDDDLGPAYNRGYETQRDPHLPPIIKPDKNQEGVELEEDPDFLNHSFPGANPQFNDDGKRLEFLHWIEKKAEVDIEIELKRDIAEEKRKLFTDAACMYDNQLFDNCFFSPRERKDDHRSQSVGGYLQIGSDFNNTFNSANELQTLLGAKSQQHHETLSPGMKRGKRRKTEFRAFHELQINRLGTSVNQVDKTERLQNAIQEVAQEAKAKLTVGSPSDKSIALYQHVSSIQSRHGSIMVKREALKKVKETGAVSSKFQSNAQISEVMNELGRATGKQELMEMVTIKLAELDNEEDQLNQEAIQLGDQTDSALQSDTLDLKSSSKESDELKDVVDEETVSKESMKLKEDMSQELKSMSAGRQTPPLKGPDSKSWISKAKLLKTLILDGTNPVLKAKNAALELEEEAVVRETIYTEDKEIDLKVEEETYNEDEAECFYRNNYPEDSSISTVKTDDHEQPANQQRVDLTAWMKESLMLHQRNFNENEVLGNFRRDQDGRIIDREKVIWENNFRDRDNNLVNQKGYLINEKNGAIRSKYSFEDLFMPETERMQDLGEIPMPFRLERYNFNPHKIMGNFEYDKKTGKPIFLKNKYGSYTDKNYRPVNESGYLINEQEDIIDNEGHVKFVNKMLTPKGNIPQLYNYVGTPYRIRAIIGRFKVDDVSKEIIIDTCEITGKAIDELQRPVNAAGYLIDQVGNIIDDKGEVIFKFWELLYQEPPKIFSFTEFSLNWIKGRLDRDVTNNPKHDDEFDLDGRRINTMGYLIDDHDNIVDQSGKQVFKKEILTEKYGQDSEIPPVFRMGLLASPINEEDQNGMAVRVPSETKHVGGHPKRSINNQSSQDADAETGLRSGEEQTTKTEFQPGTVTDETHKNGASIVSVRTEKDNADKNNNQLNINIKGFSSEPEQDENMFQQQSKQKKQTSPFRRRKRPKTTKGSRHGNSKSVSGPADITRSNSIFNFAVNGKKWAKPQGVRPGQKVLSLYQQYLEDPNQERNDTKESEGRGRRGGQIVTNQNQIERLEEAAEAIELKKQNRKNNKKPPKKGPYAGIQSKVAQSTRNSYGASKSVGRQRPAPKEFAPTNLSSLEPIKQFRNMYGGQRHPSGVLSPPLISSGISALGISESVEPGVIVARGHNPMDTESNQVESHFDGLSKLSKPAVMKNRFMAESQQINTELNSDLNQSYASRAEVIFGRGVKRPLPRNPKFSTDLGSSMGINPMQSSHLQHVGVQGGLYSGVAEEIRRKDKSPLQRQFQSVSSIYSKGLRRNQ